MIRDKRDLDGLGMHDVDLVERILKESGVEDNTGVAEKIITSVFSEASSNEGDLLNEIRNLNDEVDSLEYELSRARDELTDAENELYKTENELNELLRELADMRSQQQ